MEARGALLAVLLVLSMFSAKADDTDIVLQDAFTLGPQAWKTYVVEVPTWETPEELLPWFLVEFPTIASPGLPLAIYGERGNMTLSQSSAYQLVHSYADPSTGMTSLILYCMGAVTNVSLGVFNPNHDMSYNPWVNVTIRVVSDYSLKFGEQDDDLEMNDGETRYFHVQVSQQIADSKQGLYFAIEAQADDPTIALLARHGAVPFPDLYDYNQTVDYFDDDTEVQTLYLWIPEDQVKPGLWYFAVQTQPLDPDSDPGDGNNTDDTGFEFEIDLFTFEIDNLPLSTPTKQQVALHQFMEFFLSPGAQNKNSFLFVQMSATGEDPDLLMLYASPNTIATADHYSFELTTQNNSFSPTGVPTSYYEMVIPMGVAEFYPHWYVQVSSVMSNPHDGKKHLVDFTLQATFPPMVLVSAQSKTLPSQLTQVTIPAGSSYYLVTNDLSSETQLHLVRLVMNFHTPTMSVRVYAVTPDPDGDNSASIPTALNWDSATPYISKPVSTLKFCAPLQSTVLQPTFLAIVNSGSESVLIDTMTFSLPVDCDGPDNPGGNGGNGNGNGGGGTQFGGLGPFGLAAIVAGGVLVTLIAVCAMHRWLKHKDTNRRAVRTIQSGDRKPARRLSEDEETGKAAAANPSKYSLLHNESQSAASSAAPARSKSGKGKGGGKKAERITPAEDL